MSDIEELIKYTTSLNLLYVEDNEDARESTLFILEEFFRNIVVAKDGSEGLEQFRNSKIDLIITDINMPKMNGLDMISEIRKIDKEVSVLVLSAYNESGYFIDSIKLDVEGYLLKPIDMEQFINMLQKVTQKIKLQSDLEKNLQLLQQYQDVADKSSIISKCDLDGFITYVNDEFCRISKYSKTELLGQSHTIVCHSNNPASLCEDLWDTIKNKKSIWQGTIRNIDKYGNSYYVKTTVKPVFNDAGEVVEYISIRDNITDIMNPRKQLEDILDSHNESLLVLIKIEGFDDIERYYGSKFSQTIEDEFSKEIVRLSPDKCEFNKVFVLGNGEYAFVKNKENCTIGIVDVIANLKKFQRNINDTQLEIGGLDYDLNVVFSFAYGKNTLENVKYGLKQLSENNQDFIVANDLIQKEYEEAQKNLDTLKLVKKAIESFKIVAYFQPIVNNETLQIDKYESLVRLIDENGDVLTPFYFLESAKKGKYYSQITSMVLENSFKALQNIDSVAISINLSAIDIERRLTREKIFDLLEKNRENTHRIVFELLEDEDVKDFELIKSFIQKVKNMGVRIAIDDFGTGYSNFVRLLDYQPDILKLDASLVKNLLHDSFSLNVVETIVTFAKKLNIATVAEYVESEEVFVLLKNLGVGYSQGYYFGKPEPLNVKGAY